MDLLIVVDMQNDFIDGALGTPEAKAVLPKVVEKIKGFKGRILATRDTHTADYLATAEGSKLPIPHCIKNTDGWQLHPHIASLIKEPPLDKPAFGSAELGPLLLTLQKEQPIDRITLIGLCTDICVISNALLCKTFLPEVPIFVDASCCAGVTPQSHSCALDAMAACQIEILCRA